MMKATGIVRRIDDLGRIVIPKEIRRTLHIRESDPLEIFTDREGQVILKKYSPIGEMTTFAKQYAESLAQVSGHATLIADRDQFIAVSGGCKQLLNKSVSRQLEEKVNNRETAMLEGSRPMHTFFKIVFPLLRTPVATVCILDALSIWNDFLMPMLILSGNPNLKTIPMTQVNLFGQYTSEWNIAIAGMVLGLIPCLLFFLIMQKNIVGGLTDGAVK